MKRRSKNNVGAKRSKNNIGDRKSDAMWNTPFMDGPAAPEGQGWNTPFQFAPKHDRIYRKRGSDGNFEPTPPHGLDLKK
jgi:hypothetical protein